MNELRAKIIARINTERVCVFFSKKWSKSGFLLLSPNQNPLKYHVWPRIEEQAYVLGHISIDTLKSNLNKYWNLISASDLGEACKTFRAPV